MSAGDFRLALVVQSEHPIADEKLSQAAQHIATAAQLLLGLADTPERARCLWSLNDALVWAAQAALRHAQASAIILAGSGGKAS